MRGDLCGVKGAIYIEAKSDVEEKMLKSEEYDQRYQELELAHGTEPRYVIKDGDAEDKDYEHMDDKKAW